MIATFIIEGKPTAKGRHRTTKSGIHYTPQKTALYENWVKVCYMNRVGDKMLKGPLKATIEAYYKIPASIKSKEKRERMIKGIIRPQITPDVDNIAKAILDGLNKIAYEDDKAVIELQVSKYYAEKGFTKVTLEELEPEG